MPLWLQILLWTVYLVGYVIAVRLIAQTFIADFPQPSPSDLTMIGFISILVAFAWPLIAVGYGITSSVRRS